MKYCSGCGAALSPGARFCGNCGTPTSSPKAGTESVGTASAEAKQPSLAVTPPGIVLYVVPYGEEALARVVGLAAADHAHEVMHARGAADVQAALARLDSRAQEVAAVCVVGPHEALPHAAFPDGTDGDERVLTDNDYGMLSAPSDNERGGPLGLPLVPVTRIPTRDPALVERLLRVREGLCASWAGGLAVTAQVWESASAAVLAGIAGDGIRLHSSPAVDSAAIDPLLGSQVGRLYFNVHGSDQVPVWFGDGDGTQPEVLRPAQLQVAPDAILVSEACYGARHDSADTVVARFLEAGGSAFVGSTIIAWGPPSPPSRLADLVPLGVYGSLDAGFTLAESMHRMRVSLVEEAGDQLTPQLVNTLSSFVAYGSPLARVQGLPGSARSVAKAGAAGAASPRRFAPASSPIGDILARVRSGQHGSVGPLGAARARLAEGQRRAWRVASAENLTTDALTARFRDAGEIRASLQHALGGLPARAKVVRYATAAGEQAIITAEGAAHGFFRTRVAVVVDAGGAVCERYVTRGGRPR